ncbi:TIGR04255 family protein [Parvibaculum sedimenti]|uniref:TIGR04255 family protein n=1 Tax=Parvibaculum sedimenti TaxID=2608632 RepID=A0A6N6VJD0_9HYPH|nr:TIGR04255 family protein [Parvibaculum sedimenti]KAB7741518.1 TIGR04255 family protein [Parvibaculum sedimenti]
MAKKQSSSNRLPNAPLAEVVFELRWALQSDSTTPLTLQNDPGLIPLLDAFTKNAKKLGFASSKQLVSPLQTAPYGVVRRYYKDDSKPFPLLQIGPGIFACNDASQYEWTSYKTLITKGLTSLFSSYPKLGFFPLAPIFLELRYVDVFDRSLFGKAALFDFLQKGTSLKLDLPPMLSERSTFGGDADGRLLFRRDLKGWKDTIFSFDIGSATNNGNQEQIVRLETKVTTGQSGILALKTPAPFIKNVEKWLDFAHGITSPFFKQLILPTTMAKFSVD